MLRIRVQNLIENAKRCGDRYEPREGRADGTEMNR